MTASPQPPSIIDARVCGLDSLPIDDRHEIEWVRGMQRINVVAAHLDGIKIGDHVVVLVVPEHPAPAGTEMDDSRSLIELLRWRKRLLSDGKNTFTLGGDHRHVLEHAISALAEKSRARTWSASDIAGEVCDRAASLIQEATAGPNGVDVRICSTGDRYVIPGGLAPSIQVVWFEGGQINSMLCEGPVRPPVVGIDFTYHPSSLVESQIVELSHLCATEVLNRLTALAGVCVDGRGHVAFWPEAATARDGLIWWPAVVAHAAER